jgi:hypothetical protein
MIGNIHVALTQDVFCLTPAAGNFKLKRFSALKFHGGGLQ